MSMEVLQDIHMQMSEVQQMLGQEQAAREQLQQQLAHEQAAREQLGHQLQQQQAQSSLRTPKPPETDGVKPTPEHWCEAMETYLEQKQLNPNTPAACAFAATFLRDGAQSWYTQHRVYVHAGTAPEFSSWQQLKSAFLAHFSPYDVQEVARSKLDRLRQTCSVAEYSSKFGDLMLQLPNMDAGTRIHFYLRGLKSWVCERVAMQQPKSLEQAISLAVALDTMIYSSNMFATTPSSSGGSSGYHAGHAKQPGGSGGFGGSHASPMELGSIQRQAPASQQQANGSVPYCSWHKFST